MSEAPTSDARVRDAAPPGPDVAAAARARRAANLAAISAMLISSAFFAVGDAIVKHIGRTLPVGEIMAVRGVMACAFVLAAGWWLGPFRRPREMVAALRTPLVGWRTVGEVGSTATFFTGLAMLPLAEASAIGQFTPLAITAAAAIFLGEPVGWRRWLATFVGLVGVLVIVRPGGAAFNLGGLAVLASVGFIVLRDITTRLIGERAPAIAIVALTSLAVTLSGFAMSPFETWGVPTVGTLVLLAICALTVACGYYWAILSMQSGDIAAVSPFRYSVIVFSVALGYLVFGEVPAAETWAGIAIVIGAGLYTVHRERVRERERREL